jgi:antitoxin component HigA of HigAB toxin-antitoxin module
MEVKSIKTEADYETALQEIEQLFDAESGIPEADAWQPLNSNKIYF